MRAVIAALDEALMEPSPSGEKAGRIPVRLRAIIAALDEALRESSVTSASVMGSIRADLDVPRAVRVLEDEIAALSETRDALHTEATSEFTTARAWRCRREEAERDGRVDLVGEARVREEEHQLEATALEAEWREYSRLINEYSALLVLVAH